jgi:hypothetical protein
MSYSVFLSPKLSIELTLPYFKVFEDKGDYIPDFNKIKEKLLDNYDTIIIRALGEGDSGIAYMLSNGDVLKLTTNSLEARNARWLITNPHPNIAKYKRVWREGDLFCIVMEFIPEFISDYPELQNQLTSMVDLINKENCFNIICAINILKNDKITKTNRYLPYVIKYLKHLSKAPFQPFDFLNINNIGLKNGELLFFDIT